MERTRLSHSLRPPLHGTTMMRMRHAHGIKTGVGVLGTCRLLLVIFSLRCLCLFVVLAFVHRELIAVGREKGR